MKAIYLTNYSTEHEEGVRVMKSLVNATVVRWLHYRDTLVQEIVASEKIKDPVLAKWMKTETLFEAGGTIRQDRMDLPLPGWDVTLRQIVDEVEADPSFNETSRGKTWHFLIQQVRQGASRDIILAIPDTMPHESLHFRKALSPEYLVYLDKDMGTDPVEIYLATRRGLQ